MDTRFWTKTLLYRFFPGGFGYDRKLRGLQDPTYVHDRDKDPVRYKHHGNGGWKTRKDSDGIVYRDYSNYEEYLTHQRQKLDEMIKLKGGFDKGVIAGYRRIFYRRFKHLRAILNKSAVCLCAGARQGTEVEVLRDLGFSNAYGIDLNPGPENPLVKKGDFMNLEEKTGSVDFFYCNCIDHAFDLDRFFKEHSRVLKPDGYAIYDIATLVTGPFEAVQWDSDEPLIRMLVKHFKSVVRVQTEPGWKWILLRGSRYGHEPSPGA